MLTHVQDWGVLSYTKKPDDYLSIDTDTGAVLCEIQGERDEQEDKLAVACLPGFETLPRTVQKTLLTKVFAEMQNLADQSVQRADGSTACFASAWIDDQNRVQALTAHVGDSEAYVLIINRVEKTVHCLPRLNKILHNPLLGSDEATRIQLTGRGVLFERVNGRLAVSRAIGDQDILTNAGDHVPDVDCLMPYVLREGEEAFLLLACDGLFEQFCENDVRKRREWLTEICLAAIGLPLTEQALSLVSSAYRQSEDNISIELLPIQVGKTVSGAVFDGHAGAAVSSLLSEKFYPQLQKAIQEAIQQQQIVYQRAREEKQQALGRQVLGTAVGALLGGAAAFAIWTRSDFWRPLMGTRTAALLSSVLGGALGHRVSLQSAALNLPSSTSAIFKRIGDACERGAMQIYVMQEQDESSEHKLFPVNDEVPSYSNEEERSFSRAFCVIS